MFVAGVRPGLTIAVAAVVPVIGAVILEAGWPSFRLIHAPFHSAAEAVGGVLALGVTRLLVTRRHFRGAEAWVEWTAGALACSGILDLFHACVSVGPVFFWSRTLPTLLGGLLMACVWLPEALTPVGRPLRLGVAMAGGLCAAMVLAPGIFPAAFDSTGSYTWWAKALNMAGGFCFLGAVAFFVRRAMRATSARSDFVFASHCALFASAGLSFGLAHVWDGAWWLFHGLRLVAYLVLIRFAVDALDELQRSQEDAVAAIVLEQTARLQGQLAALDPSARAADDRP